MGSQGGWYSSGHSIGPDRRNLVLMLAVQVLAVLTSVRQRVGRLKRALTTALPAVLAATTILISTCAMPVMADSYGFAMREAQQQSADAQQRLQRALNQGDWPTASRQAQALLLLSEWITPDELDLARYVKILALTASPSVDNVSVAHDLAVAMHSRPELKALAQVQVMQAMDALEVKPDILAFVAEQAGDYLRYLPGAVSSLGARQAHRVALLPLLRFKPSRFKPSRFKPSRFDATHFDQSLARQLPWGTLEYTAVVVHRSVLWTANSASDIHVSDSVALPQSWSALVAKK